MSDKVFIDTNLLVYSISTDSIKSDKIEHLFREAFDFLVSTQVINEFVHTCYRKNLLPAADIRSVVEDFLSFFNLVTIDEPIILTAFDLSTIRSSWLRPLKMDAPFFFQKICSTASSLTTN